MSSTRSRLNSQLTDEANISPPGASRGYSPTPNCDGFETEGEDDLGSLTLILKELSGVGKEVKEFRKDMKLQLLDCRRAGQNQCAAQGCGNQGH